MGRSENPLHPAFWLGASDPRPLALFRIGFGLALLQDVLCSYLPNLFAFLADGGIVPRATLTDPALWSVFRLVGSDAGVAVLFTLGLLVLLAFTLGFHTRVATVLTFVFITSLLLHFPALCKLMTKLVLALEWAFAFLAFSPVRIATCRALAIAAAIAVQGGILTTLRVGVFTGVCLWMNTLLLQPEWLDRAEAWWGARRGSSWPFTGAPRPVPIERGQLAGAPALRLVTFAFLATLFIGEAWGPFIGSKVREPQVLVTERRYLQVSQAYDLFGSTYDLLR
ncbi:MAG: hypothetical protein JST92_09790 [Deltaproteobacteria bacterium]|nr:hypothetical protein [Deltaproteobacteria bacterium]